MKCLRIMWTALTLLWWYVGWSGKMALGRGRGCPMDLLKMSQTVCESCLSMFIFSMPFIHWKLPPFGQKASFKLKGSCLRLSETKNRIFFSSLFDRVLWNKSNEPCPAFVRYRYRIETTPQVFYFAYFFQRNRCTGDFDGAVFWPKMPKPRCVWRAATSVCRKTEGWK